MEPGSLIFIDDRGYATCPDCKLKYHAASQVHHCPASVNKISVRLEQFDKISATITQDRGKDYQHPSIDFAKANELKACVQNCKDTLVRHTLEMICLKMARLVHNPSHLDSWIDIAGYARCGVMVTEKDNEKAS